MPIITEKEAIQILRGGDVVAVPTETVYGLAGLITSQSALRKIFETKQRPFFDPLIVHVLDLAGAKDLVLSVAPVLRELAEQFWPGPLTLVLPKSGKIDDVITAGLPTVALRSPRHEIARRILAECGPFAAPSANRFGKTSPTTALDVLEELDVPVVDGGPCDVGLESTVVALNDGFLEILRPGRVLHSDLFPIAKRYSLQVRSTVSGASPGHLRHHYQPEVPLVLLRTPISEPQLREKIASQLNKSSFVLQYLQLPSEPFAAARVLYTELRRLSRNRDNIIVANTTTFGWKTDSTDLMDRLSRAATIVF